ncbi:MAG: FAD:protein FMN transferase [Verrucomicrobiales bacterium]
MLRLSTALALLLLSSARSQELKRYEFESPRMGTLFRIILYAPDAGSAEQAADSAFSLAGELNQSFSDYEADSELMQLVGSRHATVSPELFQILEMAKEIASETDGAFDITTAAHTRNWRRARITGALPSREQIDAAKAASGWKKLALEKDTRLVKLEAAGMRLDLGGIAKGYAADAMLRQLRDGGFPIASVAAGGDIAVGDPPPGRKGWKIAIEHGGARRARTLTLSNRALSTSGDDEQKVTIDGKSYSHIVDPRTGLGLTDSRPVSVLGDSATETDAFATAFSILGEQKSAAIARRRGLETIWASSQPEG